MEHGDEVTGCLSPVRPRIAVLIDACQADYFGAMLVTTLFISPAQQFHRFSVLGTFLTPNCCPALAVDQQYLTVAPAETIPWV